MPRKQKYNEFDESSTRYCEDCAVDIKISFGGEANWQSHLKSKSHKDRVAAKKQHKGLGFFFPKAAEKPNVKAALSPALSSTFPAPNHIPLPSAHSALPSVSRPLNETPKVSLMFENLSKVIKSLPETVPIAVQEDVLARFSGDPLVEIPVDEDTWEYVDRALNQIVGFGMTAQQLSLIIRRGDLGMDGIYRWLLACVEKLRISEDLLEGKIQRLVDAMHLVGATDTHSTDTTESNNALDLPLTSIPPKITGAEGSKTTKCPGYTLKFPQDQPAASSYPFLLHGIKTLPWTVTTSSDSNVLFLRSTSCAQATETSKPCRPCHQLHDDSIVMGIRHRSLDGAHENTPWAYLTPSQMYSALEKKTQDINRLKLRSLNLIRTIGVRNHHIDAWKRFSMAVGKEDIPRIKSLIATELRAGSTVFTLLERVKQAAQRKYAPRGYQEADYQLGFLIYKIGGRSAANIAHRALGIPSIDTSKRHVATKPLISSSSFPTLSEMRSNLAVCYPNSPATAENSVILGMIMETDEMKLQERMRWDPVTNCILGICREHGGQCALEFRSIHQADELLNCLKAKTVHFATEATVIGASVLSSDPNEYTTKAFVISGSCKRETVEDQEKLLRRASEALIGLSSSHGRRLYAIASDGDSRRRQALISITLSHKVESSSPLYPILQPLSLFNLRCGFDDITSDFDWKHVLKRFRNTLLRQKGIVINGIAISSSVLKSHLVSNGMESFVSDTLLAPNDRQDVVLMLKLLHALASLSPPRSDAQPLVAATRRVLCLLGSLYLNLLEAYLDISLSLNDQLTRLSAAAHLVLAIYHHDKGDFIPVQTCFDVMSMIKNVYFSVAKTQLDNPNGSFWLMLMGTDGLEKVFGQVRTMVGNDTNADQLQLGNRIDGAVQCVNILEHHPEWGGQSRRLSLKPLSKDTTISSAYDHINPKAWKGDVHVSNVVLSGCWSSGRRSAEACLSTAGFILPFSDMEQKGGFDMFCPFGGSKMMLVDGTLTAGECEETEEERADYVGPTSTTQPSVPTTMSTAESTKDLEHDFEDLSAEADVLDPNTLADKSRGAWVFVDDTKVHKATILRMYSNPLAVSSSKDRLKRVRGFSQYGDTKTDLSASLTPMATDPLSVLDAVEVQDPALILVRSNNRIFLALFQITGIRFRGNPVQRLPVSHIHEPDAYFSGQIMRLSVIDDSHQPTGPDWEWDSGFEPRSSFQNADGKWIELINPTIQRAQRGRNRGEDTYVFKTSELLAISSLIYERLAITDQNRLPDIAQTPSFPYRSAQGFACFECSSDVSQENDLDSCRLCKKVKVSSLSGPALLSHMGAHALHDPRVRDQKNLCGFCLSDGLCMIRFVHGSKGSSIDMKGSRCPNIRRINIKIAAKFTHTSPCTNHPLICQLCGDQSPAVWKYNMESHLAIAHGANPELHRALFEIHPEERVLMKSVFQTVPRRSKASREAPLPTSIEHSSRLTVAQSSSNVDMSVQGHSADTSGSENESDVEDEDEDPQEDTINLDDSSESTTPLTITSADTVHIPEPSTSTTVNSSSDTIPHRKRKARNDPEPEEIVSDRCADAECGAVVHDEDILRCNAPGCHLIYHLNCQGLFTAPVGGWFCDDECKKNAGFRVGGKRRRR